MASKAIVRLNKLHLRLRKPTCRPGELLVLIPSCLQSSKCAQRITVDVASCRRCGGCGVGEISKLCEVYGVRLACATGGRLALELVKDADVKAVVAVACDKELRSGIIGSFPKPVAAVENLRPHGPCKDTLVSLDDVRAAIERLLGRKSRR